MKIELEIVCCMCPKKYKTKIELPEGWKIHCDAIYVEDGFCAEHAQIGGFTDNCSGCTDSWGTNCPLWQAFGWEAKLTEDDFVLMRKGICPKRFSGMVGVSINAAGAQIKRIDEGEPSSKKSGVVLEKAIKDYWKRNKIKLFKESHT